MTLSFSIEAYTAEALQQLAKERAVEGVVISFNAGRTVFTVKIKA